MSSTVSGQALSQTKGMETTAMGNDVEEMVRLRRRLLRNSLIGFPIALGGQMLSEALPKDGHHGWTGVIELAGWVIFGIALYKITRVQKVLRSNPTLANALSDELWWANRYKSALFAFFVLMFTQGVSTAIFACLPHPMTLMMYVTLNLMIGYVAFIGSFLYLDRAD